MRPLGCLLLAASGASVASAITAFRTPHFATTLTPNVTYAHTLVGCTNQTDGSTCREAPMWLDVWSPVVPPNASAAEAGPFPVVLSVHGGGFVSGDPTANPPNDFWASRGFVSIGVQYRLAADKGLYPAALGTSAWSPKRTQPAAGWLPWIWQMYPATRDIRAALRWAHANAHRYGGDPAASLTLQGGSAGATAAIELALTGGAGDPLAAQDYVTELTQEEDPTIVSTNLGQPATVTGLIDYWGGIFAEDAMRAKGDGDGGGGLGRHRWSATSAPTVAFHGTDDTTVSPATGDVLCGNLTALGVPCRLVKLPGQKHACWNARVALPGNPSGAQVSLFDYAFDAMANFSNWTVVEKPGPVPGPGGCAGAFAQCGGKNFDNGTEICCQGACECEGTEWHMACKPPSGNAC
jgi:para-nitrobenzyl esterase